MMSELMTSQNGNQLVNGNHSGFQSGFNILNQYPSNGRKLT